MIGRSLINERLPDMTPNRMLLYVSGGRRGHDRMVVGFITTYSISAYYH